MHSKMSLLSCLASGLSKAMPRMMKVSAKPYGHRDDVKTTIRITVMQDDKTRSVKELCIVM